MQTIVRIQFADDDWLTIDTAKINHIRITPESAMLYLDGVKVAYNGTAGTPGYGSIVTLERHWRGEMDEATKQAIARLRCAVFGPQTSEDTAHD